MAKKATGSIEWRKGNWVGRIRLEDGTRSPWLSLGTTDRAVARERMDRWIGGGEPPTQPSKELFRDAAERIIDAQEKKGQKGAKERRHRIRAFALPVMGHLEVGSVTPANIHSALSRMGEQEAATRTSYAADTVHHLRVDISRILRQLVLEEVLTVNVARDVELPDDIEVDDRPRVVLTDDEILQFRRRGFASELDMMALVARDLGGHRTSDLHAADWSDFDTKTWATCVVRRPKTDREGSRKGKRKGRRRATRGVVRQQMRLPASVVEPLKAWWVGQGKPTTGPVFPLRRGPKAGQRKTGRGISYAQALRDALWAEGIVRPLPGYEAATGNARRALCALQVDTDETRAVDFHSFRRAFVTGLANSGLNLQTAMAAAGHSDPVTHGRYITDGVLEVPASALPPSDPPGITRQSQAGVDMPGVNPAPAPVSPDLQTALLALVAALGRPIDPIDPAFGSMGGFGQTIDPLNPQGFPRRAHQDSNLRPAAPEVGVDEATAGKDTSALPLEPAVTSVVEPRLTQRLGQSDQGPRAALLALAAEAVAIGDWKLADGLRALLEQGQPPLPDNVRKLDPTRKRRR